MEKLKIRPFLKWPGGKYRLIDRVDANLPKARKLIEPFVGGGAVFLNTAFENYLLNDANQDLITLYQTLQKEGDVFIKFCRTFFKKKYNQSKQYYQCRKEFNTTEDPVLKSALFLYLNRHGYNGLCRYNAKEGAFNVPFGDYTKPYFPEKEMFYFYEKAQQAVFVCEDFTKTLQKARKGSVVYADPPYVPLTKTAYFTNYQAKGFTLKEQETLASYAKKLAARGIPVLVSNHSNALTHQLYEGAAIQTFNVSRTISCKTNARVPVRELLALYL